MPWVSAIITLENHGRKESAIVLNYIILLKL